MAHLAEKGRFASWGFVHDTHRRPWSQTREKASLPAKTIVVPARKVVERESTTPITTSAQLVQRAIDFIGMNAHKGIGVNDVVRELGVSRRLGLRREGRPGVFGLGFDCTCG